MERCVPSMQITGWHHPDVRSCARTPAEGLEDPVEIAGRCFE